MLWYQIQLNTWIIQGKTINTCILAKFIIIFSIWKIMSLSLRIKHLWESNILINFFVQVKYITEKTIENCFFLINFLRFYFQEQMHFVVQKCHSCNKVYLTIFKGSSDQPINHCWLFLFHSTFKIWEINF